MNDTTRIQNMAEKSRTTVINKNRAKSKSTNTFREVKMISIINNEFINDAIKLVTEPYVKRGVKLIRKNSEGEPVYLKPHNVTEEFLNYMIAEGHELGYYDIPSIRGVKKLEGINVTIKPKGRSYDSRGFTVVFTAEGDTMKQMEVDGQKKEDTLTYFFTQHNVPVSKICVDLSKYCEKDFRA